MRVLHINTFDIAGGAARAVNWLHTGLLEQNIDSSMLVQQASGKKKSIHAKQGRLELALKDIRWILDYLPLMLYRHRTTTHWSTGWFPNRIHKTVQAIDPDIIHLHWVCRGFLSIREIEKLCRLKRPILWTLHDSWPFTGGCHVPSSCLKYTTGCGACPQLHSKTVRDLSRFTFNQKNRRWNRHEMTIVTPSNWLADCARNSALFADKRIEVIPNGIDTAIYTYTSKETAREALHLPQNRKKKILCGAVNAHGDPNKGFNLLYQAIDQLGQSGWKDKIELIIFGESESMADHSLPVATHFLGHLHDDVTLRLAYSAADVFVIPSLQENLPNSILESLACGTPVVAFDACGIPDIIKHEHNGYLAKPFEVEDLAQGIVQVLNRELQGTLDNRFTQASCAKQYTALYKNLLNVAPSSPQRKKGLNE